MVLRALRSEDRAEYVRVMALSEPLHAPWSPLRPPDDTWDAHFDRQLARVASGTVWKGVGVLPDGRIAGMFNLNEIVRGPFQNAYAGWAINAEVAGRGLATEGVRQLLHYAFDEGPLHFVVLHTVERKDVDVRIDEGQLAWLAEDLRATRLPVVVLMHHPASEQDLGDSRWFSRAAHIALVRERAELRRILSESKKVRLVVNGHVHRNHLDMIGGIPFVTVQSLIENLDDDAPGRPAASYAEVRLTDTRTLVTVHGNDPARYQIELGP